MVNLATCYWINLNNTGGSSSDEFFTKLNIVDVGMWTKQCPAVCLVTSASNTSNHTQDLLFVKLDQHGVLNSVLNNRRNHLEETMFVCMTINEARAKTLSMI